jgi:hypothetical protein
MSLHTTLARLKAAGACTERYRHLCKALGGIRQYGKGAPLPYSVILEHNGFDDTLWALAHGDDEAKWLCRLAALAFAQRVEHLVNDRRVGECNRITHLYLHGEESAAAWVAARDAAEAAAWDAARSAARSAGEVAAEAQAAMLAAMLDGEEEGAL